MPLESTEVRQEKGLPANPKIEVVVEVRASSGVTAYRTGTECCSPPSPLAATIFVCPAPIELHRKYSACFSHHISCQIECAISSSAPLCQVVNRYVKKCSLPLIPDRLRRVEERERPRPFLGTRGMSWTCTFISIIHPKPRSSTPGPASRQRRQQPWLVPGAV